MFKRSDFSSCYLTFPVVTFGIGVVLLYLRDKAVVCRSLLHFLCTVIPPFPLCEREIGIIEESCNLEALKAWQSPFLHYLHVS